MNTTYDRHDAQKLVPLLDAIPSANGGSLVTADLGDTRLCFSVAEPGEHWISNSLAVTWPRRPGA